MKFDRKENFHLFMIHLFTVQFNFIVKFIFIVNFIAEIVAFVTKELIIIN